MAVWDVLVGKLSRIHKLYRTARDPKAAVDHGASAHANSAVTKDPLQPRRQLHRLLVVSVQVLRHEHGEPA